MNMSSTDPSKKIHYERLSVSSMRDDWNIFRFYSASADKSIKIFYAYEFSIKLFFGEPGITIKTQQRQVATVREV